MTPPPTPASQIAISEKPAGKMTILKILSTEELQAELDRRNQPQPPTPQPVENPDWTQVQKLCVMYIEAIEKDNNVDDDSQYIFEAAIKAVYGPQVWGWVNDKLR